MLARAILLGPITLLIALGVPAVGAQPADGCTGILTSGEDIGAALRRSAAAAVICLSPGRYGPLTVGPDAPPDVTIRGSRAGATIDGSAAGPALSVQGAQRLTIASVLLRGGLPAALRAEGARALVLRDLRIENPALGVLLDAGTDARVENVTIAGTLEAGLVVRGRATAEAVRLTVAGSGIGAAAILDGARLTLRESTIEGGAGPAVFAGVPGCGDLGAATLEPPACFLENLQAFVSDARIALDRVTVAGGAGPGIVLFPGTQAEIERSAIRDRQRGGLLAWGARVTIAGSNFEENWEQGVEFRAYPDPRSGGWLPASGSIVRSSVRGTRALGGPILGNGIVVRDSTVRVLDNSVSANEGTGIAMLNRATGEVSGNRVLDNRGDGFCLTRDAVVVSTGNTLAGNRSDEPAACG